MNGLIMKILRGSFLPLPPHYTSDLRALIGKLLAKAPSRRPDMNQLLEEPLVKIRLDSARAVAEARRPGHAAALPLQFRPCCPNLQPAAPRICALPPSLSPFPRLH